MSKNTWNNFDLFNPTEEHQMLRQTVREFVEKEVEGQAAEYDRKEQFNLPLFRKLGDLGLLGITVDEKFGGSAMDAISAVIAHEEISASDPASSRPKKASRTSTPAWRAAAAGPGAGSIPSTGIPRST